MIKKSETKTQGHGIWQPTSPTALRGEIQFLREENIELKERIERLEKALIRSRLLRDYQQEV